MLLLGADCACFDHSVDYIRNAHLVCKDESLLSDRRFTLGRVVELTGAGRRAVQLWADGGVIQGAPGTDRAGTGVHRQFDERELQIAALLVPLANMGTPIGVLRRFAEYIRGALWLDEMEKHAPAAAKEWKRRFHATKDFKRGLERARRGEGENWLMFAY